MNPECEKLLRWLDEAAETPPGPDLEAHAAACDTCRRRLAVERALRDRLGAGAAIDPARRAALVGKICDAKVAAARPHARARRFAWVAAAAAAAAVLMVAFLAWPGKPHEPILPTQIFGDLLGPLAEMVPASEPSAPAPTQDDSSPLGMVLAVFWGDLEAPLSVGRDALEAPRVAANIQPTPKTAPAKPSVTEKEK